MVDIELVKASLARYEENKDSGYTCYCYYLSCESSGCLLYKNGICSGNGRDIGVKHYFQELIKQHEEKGNNTNFLLRSIKMILDNDTFTDASKLEQIKSNIKYLGGSDD